MVVFDTNFLMLLLDPNAKSSSGKAISDDKERIDFLVKTLSARKEKIVIPAPVIAEFLVGINPSDREKHISCLTKSVVFRIEAFGLRAAIENADLDREIRGSKGKKGSSEEPWQKIKIDRQIIAIAKVSGASTLYSMDKGLSTLGESVGMIVVSLAELPLPPESISPMFPGI
ncbi:PIN domain-containing protein [uncultured Gammaproteobacteria bacterium]